MRTRHVILAAAAALALAGCGDRNLVVNVDVLSYLDPADTIVEFGPLPPAPGGLASGEVPLVDGMTVNLVEGLSSVAEVRAVQFHLSAIARDSTGTGSDTLRVYLSDMNYNPLWTPPVIERAVVLQPGRTDTIQVDVAGDQRVADLFMGRSLKLSVTTSVRGPIAGDPLNGRLTLRALEAVVIAGRKPF